MVIPAVPIRFKNSTPMSKCTPTRLTAQIHKPIWRCIRVAMSQSRKASGKARISTGFVNPPMTRCWMNWARPGDLAKRGEIAIKLNNMLTKDSYTIVPLVHRGRVSAHAKSLGGVILNTWDSELWNVADWHRIK